MVKTVMGLVRMWCMPPFVIGNILARLRNNIFRQFQWEQIVLLSLLNSFILLWIEAQCIVKPAKTMLSTLLLPYLAMIVDTWMIY